MVTQGFEPRPADYQTAAPAVLPAPPEVGIPRLTVKRNDAIARRVRCRIVLISSPRRPSTLSAETLIAVLTEIGRSVARAGPRRLVILNSHGGQPQVVDIVCRRLRGDGMFAVNCMASRLGLPPDITLTREEQAYGIHGGLVETSLMLHLRPDLVRTDRAIDFRSAWLEHEGAMTTLTPEGGVGFGWETQDLHRLGALGSASAATAAIGRAILEHQAARLAKLLDEVRRIDLAAWMQPGP